MKQKAVDVNYTARLPLEGLVAAAAAEPAVGQPRTQGIHNRDEDPDEIPAAK